MSGYARTDWEAAFAFYASLDPAERSHRRVADEYGVSLHTVKDRSRRHRWTERLADIEEQARRRTNEQLVRDRADRISDTIRIIDAARIRFAQQLTQPGYEIKGHELAALLKMEALLEGEATDRVSDADVEEKLSDYLRRALQFMSPDQARAFLASMREPRQLPAAITVDHDPLEDA